MKSPGKLGNRFFLSLRWIARILGSLVALLIIVFVLGYAIGGDPKANEETSLKTMVFPAIIFTVWIAGVALAWKWEGIGGGILFLSSIVFFIAVSDALWPPNPLSILPITGVLFLVCWWKSKTTT